MIIQKKRELQSYQTSEPSYKSQNQIKVSMTETEKEDNFDDIL